MSAQRELLLVRHPKVSVSDICYGHADVPAPFDDADLETLLAKLPAVSAVWTSPLSRCSALATRIAERKEVALHSDERLRELGFGQFEGLPWSEIEARYPADYARWMRDWRLTPPPGGETLTAFTERVHRAVFAISEASSGDAPILIVTHAGVIRTLLRLMRNLSWDEALSTPVAHMDPVFFLGPMQDPGARPEP